LRLMTSPFLIRPQSSSGSPFPAVLNSYCKQKAVSDTWWIFSLTISCLCQVCCLSSLLGWFRYHANGKWQMWWWVRSWALCLIGGCAVKF
jgi:hypothetical protein